jgi:hypothetical protein
VTWLLFEAARRASSILAAVWPRLTSIRAMLGIAMLGILAPSRPDAVPSAC